MRLPAPFVRKAWLVPLGLLCLAPSVPDAMTQDVPQGPLTPVEDTEPVRILKLTLENSVRIALENNLGLELEELSTTIARYDAYGSWGAFDPVFSATGGWNEQEFQGQSSLAGGVVVEDDSLTFDSSLNVPLMWTGGSLDFSLSHSNDETTNQFAAFATSTTDVVTVALTQPLLRGAWKRYATAMQREAEIAFEIQKEGEKEARQALVLDVVQGYWNLVSAVQELEVRVLSVQLAWTQLHQDERRLEVGTGTEVDVLQSKTNLAQQEEVRINAEFALRQAEDDLRRLLFQKPRGDVDEYLDEWEIIIEPLTPLPEVRDTKLDWRRSLERAIQLRPELWQRRLEIDAAEVQLERSRSEKLPQLDLALSSAGIGFDTDPDEARDTALGWDFPRHEASLTFSIPILNRTAKYAERAARASLRQSRLIYDRQELDILTEVRAAVRDVAYRAESVQAAQTSAELAARQLEAEEARHRIGLSTTFLVLDFQRDLAEARSTLVAARAAYAMALASLRFSEGLLATTPMDELAGDGGD